jgi:ArsR family transcriptional regulator
MDIPTAVINLAALAQESRLQIFRLLVTSGPEGMCVGDIGAQTAIAPATLSFHLKELCQAGLITANRKSRHIYYAPDFVAMDSLVNYLTENCCDGKACALPTTKAVKKKVSKS